MLVFLVILGNTASMASEDMSNDAPRAEAAAAFEKASTALFALEAALKIVDQGLGWAADAYLASGWNQFDFALVCGTVSSLFTETGSQFMAMRAVRCFRPLRAMKNFRDGQLLMRTTLTAIPLLRDALVFLCWFMLVASVSGTMAFAGRLTGRCVSAGDAATPNGATPNGATPNGACPPPAHVSDDGATCDPRGRGYACDAAAGETCCVSAHTPVDGFLSFDDFSRSAMVVLNVVTIDGWNELAWETSDGAGVEAAFPYFAVIVFFGGFYVMQLFQSVMIITLSHTSDVMDAQDARDRRGARRRRRKRGAADDDDDETEPGAKKDVVDVDGVGMLINAVGAYAGAFFRAARRTASAARDVRNSESGGLGSVSSASVRAMEKEKKLRATAWGRFRLRAKRVANAEGFQRFVILVICANTVTMALDSYGQSEAYYAALNTCETVFTSVFIAEFVTKHLAVGPRKYWSNPWNVVDGAVVVSGVAELALGAGADGIATLRMLRVLRIFAGLKGLRRHRAFRQVFAAVINGVRRILSFCLVFSLFLTVFAILGMQLFGGAYGDAAPDSRATFDTFGDAMLALFIICTGENTFSIGWDLTRASGTKWAVVYVAAWSLVSTSLLALVLGVLIQATVEHVVLPEAESDSDDDIDEVRAREAPASEREATLKPLARSGSVSPFASPHGSRDATPRARDAPTAKDFAVADARALSSARGAFLNIDDDDDAVADSKRGSERIRKNTEVEVAAVRLWLDEHGFDVEQRDVLRVGFVDGEVRRSVTQAGETADDVRGRFSERELRAARERLTDARRTGVLVNERAIRAADDDDDDDDHARRRSIENGDEARRTAWGFGGTAVPLDDAGPRAIRFGMGTTSTAQTPAAMLKRKAEAREAKIREDWRVAALDPSELRRERFEARCAEVGVDPEKDRVRAFCLKAMEHRYARFFILTLIVVSACLLAPQCDKDWPAEGSGAETAVAAVDAFFTAAFAAEMAAKVTAYTATSGPKAYFKDGWNALDGFIVATSLLAAALRSAGGGLGGNLKVFRILRVLRPLRVIKNVPSLKLVIDATLVSLPSILIVCALGAATFLILGVLGMALFRGAFRECTVPNAGGDAASCAALGGEFVNAPLHFDNIGQAVVAVFVISTGDNWQDIMYLGMDAAGEDREPATDARKNYAAFFVLAVVVAFFFWANLFVSSLVDNFSTVASQIGGEDGGAQAAFAGAGYTYSESQRRWLLALKAGWRAAAEKWRDENPLAMPAYRRWAFTLRNNKLWEPFMVLFITANAVQLCFYRDDAGKQETRVMSILSAVFCALYVLETFVNVVAMRWRRYWRSGWHRLDFTVTALGVLELVVIYAAGEDNAGFVTVFRTARFFRLFKLLKTSPGLRSLVDTFLTALPGMLNIFGLMALMMHIYACLGCTLYGDVPEPYPGDGITRYANFQNWTAAISLLYVSLSGNWAEIFKDVYWECATGDLSDPSARTAEACASYRFSAIFYFFSFVVFAVYLLANLFVAILIERFDYCSTMEGVYDKQDPFDALVRLNVLRKFGTKVRNRLRLARTLQRVETKAGRRSVDGAPVLPPGTGGAARGVSHGVFARHNSRITSFRGANDRLRQIAQGPRLRAFRTLKNNLDVALRGLGAMPSERAMDLVQHAYDADAAAREREEAENKKQALAGVYASAGAEVVAADGDDSDGDEETPGGILGALARLAFSPSRASDASGRGSG